MKVSEIVTQALAKLGVVQHGAAPTADEMASGVRAFNAMVAGWALDGINLWLSPEQDALADYPPRLATEDSGIPPAFVEGAVFCLASRLAPEYDKAIAWDDRVWLRKMRAALLVVPKMRVEPAVAFPASQRYRWGRQ